MKKLLHLRLHRSWSILLQSVSGASRSLFLISLIASGLAHAQTLPDQDLSLEILPTGEKLLHWTGHPELTYFLQASPNLQDWTWAPNIEPGIDGSMSYEVDGPTTAGFFRLQYTDQAPAPGETVSSADYDGDGLTNLQEITPRPRPGGVPIGVNLNPNIQTNPLRKDTDGDGLDDKWEEENGLDPTDDGSRDPNNGPNGDPDGDGVNNLQEMNAGTDPRDSNDFGPQMISVTRTAWSSAFQGGTFWRWANWLPKSAESQVSMGFTLSLASGYAALLGFPELPPTDPALRETGAATSGTSTYGYNEDLEGLANDRFSISHKRIWIKAPAKPTEQEFCYLKIETRTTETPGLPPVTTTTIEPIVFKIPANQTLSDSIKIIELPDSVPDSKCYLNCQIQPLSVRGYWTKPTDPHSDPIIGTSGNDFITEKTREYVRDSATQFPLMQNLSEMKISQWGDGVFVPNGPEDWQFDFDGFKLDFDVFQVKLPDGVAPPASGKHQVQVMTLREDGSILDSGAVVELDGLESQKLCLVADEDDDRYPVDGKEDGDLNDHTYLAQLGGRVRLIWLTPPSGPPMALGEIPVPVKKVVTVKGFILKAGSSSPTPVITVAQAEAYFERARRILATCGVKLEYSASDVLSNPAGVVFGPSDGNFDPPNFNVDHIEMTPESIALMNSSSCKPPENVIPVYFVGSFPLTPDGKALNGCSNSRSLMQSDETQYADAVFIDSTSFDIRGSTPAHELMHILLDAAHDGPKTLWGQSHTQRSWCIWHTHPNFPPIEVGISARRRVEDSMRFRMLKSPFCKKP